MLCGAFHCSPANWTIKVAKRSTTRLTEAMILWIFKLTLGTNKHDSQLNQIWVGNQAVSLLLFL
jgi:hypothetical protein